MTNNRHATNPFGDPALSISSEIRSALRDVETLIERRKYAQAGQLANLMHFVLRFFEEPDSQDLSDRVRAQLRSYRRRYPDGTDDSTDYIMVLHDVIYRLMPSLGGFRYAQGGEEKRFEPVSHP